jgi:hypothetical protein
VIRYQCPRQHLGCRAGYQLTEASEEVISIGVVAEYGAALETSGKDVVQIPRCVQAGTTRHDRGVSWRMILVMYICADRGVLLW